MSLAAKLQALRRKTGESLQRAADGVGVSKAHFWALERGDADNPSRDLLRKISEHFNVTVAYLIDDTAEPEEASALQFFREFDGQLSEQDWDMLRGLAKGLKVRKE